MWESEVSKVSMDPAHDVAQAVTFFFFFFATCHCGFYMMLTLNTDFCETVLTSSLFSECAACFM